MEELAPRLGNKAADPYVGELILGLSASMSIVPGLTPVLFLSRLPLGLKGEGAPTTL